MSVAKKMAGSLIAAVCLLVPGITPTFAAPPAQSGDAALVIELINQLRAEYGLAPYVVHQTLMAVAQAHAEYEAAYDILSHTGADGSRPLDRALAAGYGVPGSTFMHENIYAGTNAAPYDALAWWRNSPLHLQGMTQTGVREIGVGVARSASDVVYYVAMFGLRVGEEPAASSEPVAVPTSASLPENPARVVTPVELATAGPDGAIWHEVKSGQAVWHIAQAYHVDVYVLLEQNGLSETSALIHPGDLLLIQPAPPPTPSPTTPPREPPDLPAVTPTRTPAALASAATPSRAESPDSSAALPPVEESPPGWQRPLRAALWALGGIGLVLIAAGALGARRRKDRS
jgi:uncharacterized protein YkwD